MTLSKLFFTPRGWLVLALMLALLYFLYAAIVSQPAVVYGTHAVIRHGTEAEAVREAIQCGQTFGQMFNPANKHSATICQLDDGRYGVQICAQDGGKLCEITSFLKNKMKTLEQVRNYLQNRGYQ